MTDPLTPHHLPRPAAAPRRPRWLWRSLACWLACAAGVAPVLAATPAVGRDIRNAVLDCLIEPRQVVELRSPVEGVIERVAVDRGAQVRKGQVLVVLESSVERSSLALARQRAGMVGRVDSARNRVAFAKKKHERSQQLLEQNFVSPQARDEAQTELQLAEAELVDALENQQLARLEARRAEDQLALRSIRSPFDGHVVERLLHPGDLAESGTGRKPLLKLAQIDVLRVELVLPPAARGQVRVGSRLMVQADGVAEAQPALVTVVDRVMDAASGTFGVRLELPNRAGLVMAGSRCRVELAAAAPGSAP